ncbi:MAG: sn-glycerol-3-phosphate ABC transporter ATP-binding protein UgpC [Firmicutes bacterium]|nr:sn-glycerol-3-phosphate ABC transporter ATP-binding protein UgpC [Bacillota bacterium]
MAQVLLKDITKRFGNVTAVDNISLDIDDEEFIVLVGPSGCGKTTTLRMVAGLEEITSGTIYIGDTVVNDVPPKDRDIAMVFQNYALYPHMDVYNNMAFGLKLRKFPKNQIDQRVKEASRLLGIENLLDRKPKALSGGQRQRVAVGRAIVREPKVFLMDEPLSNLDAKLRVQMRAELSKLHNRLRTTIMYVTHDQTEAMTMGDRIVVMKDGHIYQVGAPLEIYKHPDNIFVAGFIGSPAMNFLDVVLRKEGETYTVDSNGIKVEIPAEKAASIKNIGQYVNEHVVLGIRPEEIEDAVLVADDPRYATIEADVDVTEPMGSEVYAYLTSGDNNFIARLDASTDAVDSSKIRVGLNMHSIHLFDKDTENVIR